MANLLFAYKWFAACAELAVFDPVNPNANLLLDNAKDPGPRDYVIALSTLATVGREVRCTRSDMYEQRFHYSDVVSAFDKVNVCVFWKDKLLNTVDPAERWSNYYADQVSNMNEASDDKDDKITLGSAQDDGTDVAGIDVADLIRRFGISFSSFRGDDESVAETEVPTLAPRLSSPVPSSIAVEGASIPAAEEDQDDRGDPFDLREWYRSVVLDLENRFKDLKLFMAMDGDIDVIPQEINLPIDPRFVELCNIYFPAAAEL